MKNIILVISILVCLTYIVISDINKKYSSIQESVE